MSDMAPPGFYEARGDEPGTVRYWDGSDWTSEPMPPPPGWGTNQPDARFATVWVRIGATMLDGLVSVVVIFPFMWSTFIDAFDQIDAGAEADEIDVTLSASVYVAGITLIVVFMLMVAFLGATPGKLMLKLRITTEDGTTTPPGLPKAMLRSIPQVLGWIPVIGSLIGFTVGVLSLVWVKTDPERRSVYDRIAGTRVVYTSHRV